MDNKKGHKTICKRVAASPYKNKSPFSKEIIIQTWKILPLTANYKIALKMYLHFH